MTKEQNLEKLKKIYTDIPEDKQEKVNEILEKMADVLVMMDECREHINQEGCVTEMSQGKYSIMRENPYSKVYDAKYKLMLATIDKLNKLTEGKGIQKDELMAFLDDSSA